MAEMFVCERCLRAIESREGSQAVALVYDGDDDYVGKCDWCGEEGFDYMYILIKNIVPDRL